MEQASKGKALKGQKWDKEKKCWYFPEGVQPPAQKPVVKKEQKGLAVKIDAPITAGEVAEIVNQALEQERKARGITTQVDAPRYNGDAERHLPIATTDITDEDALEKPVNYFAWNRMVYIDSYVDKGRVKNPPYNRPIVLSPMPPLVDTDERGERKELQRCMVEIWSKSQVHFIETHPMFSAGLIMKDASELRTEDIKYIHLKTQVIASVARMAKTELITQCRGRQIVGLDNDFDKMRNKLIESMCKEITNQNKAKAEKMAKETRNAEAMYGK